MSEATQNDRGPSIQIAAIQRGDAAELRISLDEFKGHRYLSLRQWNKAPDGGFRPDPKRGCSIKLRELADVITALDRAAELASGARAGTET